MNAPKTILITGATGGIGLPVSWHLARLGMSLILCARNRQRLTSLAQDLGKVGPKPEYFNFDFEKSKSLRAFLRRLSRYSGGLDGLVLIPPPVGADETCTPDDARWRAIFDRCFVGPLALIREAIQLLARTDRPKVVIVSSIASKQLLPRYPTSSVVRAAWSAEVKALAFAYGSQNIHFNTLSLGTVQTPKSMARLFKTAERLGLSAEDFLKQETSNVPLGKYATVEEVAKVVECLLSSFSDHITGANVPLEGGFLMSY